MRRSTARISWITSLLWLGVVQAQLVPQVQVPGLPLPNLPVDTGVPAIDGALRNFPTRAVRASRLLAEHRTQLDQDPHGELVVRAEVVAIDITEAALAKALQAKFLVLRTQELAELAVKITVLQTPPGWTARRGLKRLRKLDPEGSYDFNHVYLDSGGFTGARVVAHAAVDTPAQSGGAAIRIGLVDTGVDPTHVTLRDNVIHHFGCGDRVMPGPHGTAVASLLAGSAANFRGAAPRAELFAADVYCDQPAGGAVDAVAAALGWMAKERIAVVNVSLVGPRNALLERAVKTLVSRGHLIVAAVGNDGPAAPPLYPAAYQGVVGVTAVDARNRVLLEACRGKHLALAAPGADLQAAASGQAEGYTEVRGTSFAAPLVAGLLARSLREPDAIAGAGALAALTEQALDLGPRGRDEIYGAGLVARDLAPGAIK